MNRGFTLMEVLVAMVVFSIGLLALDSAFRGFNSQRRLEQDRVYKFLCEEAALESLVAAPPACSDSHPVPEFRQDRHACGTVLVHLLPVYGGASLALAEVLSGNSWHPSPERPPLRRLVRCR
ncbi:MAG: type II secretion system GspH family protein [Fibrobacter sp.]|nr:type II secretion system GspH family protein [Fibrobacter sp.]